MSKQDLATQSQGDIIPSNYDGGGYVYRPDDEWDPSLAKAPLKKQISATKLRNLLGSGGVKGISKTEMTSLERYRKEMEDSRLKKERPGFLRKAMDSIRNFDVAPEEFLDNTNDDNDGNEKKLRPNMLSTSVSGSLLPGSSDKPLGRNCLIADDEDAGDEEVGHGSKTLLNRSSSTPSTKDLEEMKYKNVFKKAVNMAALTSLLSAGERPNEQSLYQTQLGEEKTDQSCKGTDFQSRKAKTVSLGCLDGVRGTDNPSQMAIADAVSSSNSKVDAMTVKELRLIIFQSSDSMSVGDLKRLIRAREKGMQEHEEKTSSTRTRSTSCTSRRSRSSSQTRRRQSRENTIQDKAQILAGSHGTVGCTETPDRRRRSLVRRRGSFNALSASDHSGIRRQRRTRKKSFDGNDSTMSMPEFFTDDLNDVTPEKANLTHLRNSSRSRRRSTSSLLEGKDAIAAGNIPGGERQPQVSGATCAEMDVFPPDQSHASTRSRSREYASCALKRRNSLKYLMDGLEVTVDTKTNDRISQLEARLKRSSASSSHNDGLNALVHRNDKQPERRMSHSIGSCLDTGGRRYVSSSMTSLESMKNSTWD